LLNRCRAFKVLPRVRIPPSPPGFIQPAPEAPWHSRLDDAELKFRAGDQIFPARLEAIASARHTVDLTSPYFVSRIGQGHPINRVLGEEGANKVMAKAGALISSADRRVIRLNEELSFRVGTTSQVR